MLFILFIVFHSCVSKNMFSYVFLVSVFFIFPLRVFFFKKIFLHYSFFIWFILFRFFIFLFALFSGAMRFRVAALASGILPTSLSVI